MSTSGAPLLPVELCIVPISNCSHGCPAAAQDSIAVVGSENYPYNSTAAFIMDRLVFHMRINYPPDSPTASMQIFQELVDSPEHEARIDANLILSLLMVGTDHIRSYTGIGDHGGKEDAAVHLAFIISYLDEYLILQSVPSDLARDRGFVFTNEMLSFVKQKVLQAALSTVGNKTRQGDLNLDCTLRIVLFYDSRTPCSCLDQAKEHHKQCIVGCMNPGCKKCNQNVNLKTCGGCDLVKYCCRECQTADWPKHKTLCKKVQKERKQAK